MHRSIDNSLSSTCPQHFNIEWPFCGTSRMWTVKHEISADICRHSSRDEQLQWDHCTRPKPRTQPAGRQLSIERGKESQRGLAKQYGAAESGCISSGLQWGQQCCSRCQDTTSGTHQRCLKHSLVALQCSKRLRCIFLTAIAGESASANIALAHKFMLWQACPMNTVSTEPEPCCRPSLVHNIMGSVE